MAHIMVLDPENAPCCLLIVECDDRGEKTGRDLLVQSDWAYPGLAGNFGFMACECGETDGTVVCEHKTVGEMIAAARAWLIHHEGEIVEDPGYFSERSIRR